MLLGQHGDNVHRQPLTPIRTFQTKNGIVRLKNFGNVLISSGEDNKLRLWKMDHRTGDLQLLKTWKGHKGPVQKMAMFHNLLYTTSPRDKVMRSWDLQSQERGPDFEGHTKPLTDVDVDDSAKVPVVFTSSFDWTIRVWDGKTGVCQAELKGHTEAVTCIKVHGNYLISGSADTTVRVWDKRKLNCIHELKGHTSIIFGLCVKEKVIYSHSKEGAVILWKLKTGEQKMKIETEYTVTNTKVFKKYILVSGTNTLETFNHKGKRVANYEHGSEIQCACFYDQDYIFSATSDRTIRLWNVKRGQHVNEYRGHVSPVNSIVCWREWIFTASLDGTIRQWQNTVHNGAILNNNLEEWIY